MIKSILGGKSKNLFDITKVTQSAKLKNNGNGTLTVSGYGISAGILRDLCPNIKVGDTIKAYYTPISWTAPNPPRIIVISRHTVDRLIDSSFVVTEADLNGKVYFYNNTYTERNLPGTTVIGNIFITNDTTVTATNYKDRYVPHELTSYKSIMKVSDVCQLLDKSKYPATHTKLGCTFTNNGDGSFTINGTIQNGGSWSEPLQQITQNLYGHKILLLTNSTSDIVRGEMKFTLQNGSSEWGTYNSIYTVIYDDYKYIDIRIFMHTNDTGKTIDNATVKFQLFDLTEMFGPGNEPKTVAEFKAKFPNDYYPYSPSCFVTSFDERMPCSTKNLFDIDNAVPYAFNNDNPNGNLMWLKDGIYTTRMNNYNIGSGLRIKDGLTLPAGTYVVSAKIVDFNNVEKFFIGFRYKITDGTWKVSSHRYEKCKVGDRIAIMVTLPENTDVRLYLTYQNNNGVYLTGYVSYKDIQLEKGTTATDYVPYGYV